MFICKNPGCPRSYNSGDGQIVVNHVQQVRAAHNAGAQVHPPHILQQLAPNIYQNGEPPCAGCGQVNNLAHYTGPVEPAGVNTLLENIELLQQYGVLPA
jgi:hypothetical protein